MADLSPPELPLETEVEIRVRYCECDPQKVAHHSVFPVWLEIARTELLRRRGAAYRDLEAAGIFFVVVRLSVQFKKPARYDQVLKIHVRDANPPGKRRGVKLEHEYRITADGQLIATAATTLACVDGDGRVQPIPEHVLGDGAAI